MKKKDQETVLWIAAALIALAAVVSFFQWLGEQWWLPLLPIVLLILFFTSLARRHGTIFEG